MGRLLAIWSSWSVRRRAITVLVAAVAAGGLGVLAYELLKRPPDVVNENVDFAGKEQPETEAEAAQGHDVRLAHLRVQRRSARATSRATRSSRRSTNPTGASRAGKLLEFSPIIVGERPLLHGHRRAVLRAQHAGGQGRVAGSDRRAERVGPRLRQPPAVRRQPRARAGVRASAPDGKMLWKTPLPGRSESSPLAFKDELVIFGCECGTVFALDQKNGSIEWTVETGGRDQGCARAGRGQRLRRQLRGRVLRDRRRVREHRVEDQHDRRRLRPRRRHLLDAGGGVRPRVLREHRLARLQPGHGHGRDRVVEVDGR